MSVCGTAKRLEVMTGMHDAAAFRVCELEGALRLLLARFGAECEAFHAWNDAGAPEGHPLEDDLDGAVEALHDAIDMAEEILGGGSHDA